MRSLEGESGCNVLVFAEDVTRMRACNCHDLAGSLLSASSMMSSSHSMIASFLNTSVGQKFDPLVIADLYYQQTPSPDRLLH